MEFCRVYHEIKAPTNRQYGKPEITGKIVFTPDLQKGEVWTDNGVVVPALPITCDVIDGTMYDRNGEYPSRYANLMAGGPDSNPNTMNWRVSYHDMRVGDESFYIEPFVFKAIPYVKVNLAHVTPVAGYTPPGVIRGATGSPGVGIIFKGIVLTQEDLPVDGVENNHAYAITSTKDLAVWQDNEWLIIPNFANFDVSLEALSDLLYEARKNAEYSQGQVVEMDRLHALAEKYSQAARDAVDLGRSYIRKMEDHVSASTTAAGKAEDLAAQAAAAAKEAVVILDKLNPLRDDVDAVHAEVVRLHDEASQFTTQAAEHVLLASQHAADAQNYAQQALIHEAEGRRQANAAIEAAGTAEGFASQAQHILDDADAILSQVSGYSQEAKDALSGAESLLANAGGEGKPLSAVLFEVAQKHQETLSAHSDILDLHTEVLVKHSEAIRYVAMAASQASMSAQFAAQAAQEALNVATDAALAAASAADAADEAAAAASNNQQAITKLQEADGKLQEADTKLQAQMRVLEESQRALARAVQLLAGAVAQAAAAAQHAAQAANDAGEAAYQALNAVDASAEAVEAWRATEDAINAEQNDLIEQIKTQQEEMVRLRNESVNVIMATQAGTSFPGVDVRPSPDSHYDWEFTIPDTKGALAKIEFWKPGSGAVYTNTETQVTTVTAYGHTIRTFNGRFVQVTWAKPRAIQRSISDLSTIAITPGDSVWETVRGIDIKSIFDVSQGYLTVKARWSAANRSSKYGIRLLINGVAGEPVYTYKLGPLTFLGDGVSTYTVRFTNITTPPDSLVQVQVFSSANKSSSRRVDRVEVTGSWVETA